jgi:hypothetical protein
MIKKNLALLFVLLIISALLLAACAGGVPDNVKNELESKLPGSQVSSAQKAKIPAGEPGKNAWCVVTESSGNKTNWVVVENTLEQSTFLAYLQGADKAMFSKYGCTNWNK